MQKRIAAAVLTAALAAFALPGTASGGAAIAVAPVREVDVLVVPGFELHPAVDLDGTLAALRPEIETIRSTAQAGVSLVSVCVGAFLLADAGLLDGRRSTTSWLFADRLARRCPATDVRPAELVVTDRGVTTTAAFSAMYDFALGFIRGHNGARVARATARIALVDDARSSQTPYVDARLLPRPGRGVLPERQALAGPAPPRAVRPGPVGRDLPGQHPHAAAAIPGRDRGIPARLPAGRARPQGRTPAGDHGQDGGPHRR